MRISSALRERCQRLGAITVQAALLMVALFGAIACACDVGWIVLARTQLQVAADSGALAAGTALLAGLSVSPSSPATVVAAARQYASEFSGTHRNGELSSTYLDTSRDVEFGWAVQNPSTGAWTKTFGATLPTATGYNMVRVTARRDVTGSIQGDKPLPLFLGGMLGKRQSEISATATAILMPPKGATTPGDSDSTVNLIPFTYKYDMWRKYTLAQRYYNANGRTKPSPVNSVQVDMSDLSKGWYKVTMGLWENPPAQANAGPAPTTPEPLFGHFDPPKSKNAQPTYVEDFTDAFTRSGATVVAGQDGILEVNIYPNVGYPSGNFGTIDIGSASNGTNEVKRQIVFGVNASDLSHYANNAFTLPRDTEGDTGLSAGFKAELESIVSQCRVIPLFHGTVTGNGNNSVFPLYTFAGIRIMAVDLTSGTKSLLVQRCDTTLAGGIADYTGVINPNTSVYTPLILLE